MKLKFRLLVVDDQPESIAASVARLGTFLESKGFELEVTEAPDLSSKAIREFARRNGRDIDLVAIDYNLGDQESGAVVASELRTRLPYTDVVFYSSSQNANLINELANQGVAGVFTANRDTDLPDVLSGVAGTIIGKAIDLNHMRGIAMAEVAEMDVMIDAMLATVFSAQNDCFNKKAARTVDRIVMDAEKNSQKLRAFLDAGEAEKILGDGRVFSSSHKYWALCRVIECLDTPPEKDVLTLKTYDVDVLETRNTLAHAREQVGGDGEVTIQSVRKGRDPLVIDDAWMTELRGKLRVHRAALTSVCQALNDFVGTVA